MLQLEPVIRDSINHYTRILALLQNMDGNVGTASQDELLEMSASLGKLQESATQLDQAMLDQLQKVPAKSENIASLLEKREKIVKEVLLLNESITSKAMGIKSLLAHQLGTLRGGLSAMKGYRQQEHGQGRIVNSTS